MVLKSEQKGLPADSTLLISDVIMLRISFLVLLPLQDHPIILALAVIGRWRNWLLGHGFLDPSASGWIHERMKGEFNLSSRSLTDCADKPTLPESTTLRRDRVRNQMYRHGYTCYQHGRVLSTVLLFSAAGDDDIDVAIGQVCYGITGTRVVL